jgi:hypothetical protein
MRLEIQQLFSLLALTGGLLDSVVL